ncbi:685_t:CDS:2, partial [Funneliformis geosporum]
MFHLVTNFQPKGDQPSAIKKIVENIRQGQKEQVLLGATGTGKTFTMANIIQQTKKPTLILVHNKTLAMQIYQEMQGFFPHNKVEYYVSYFDYYQPEAYKPTTDLYIGKKVQRNASIAKMRLKTLNALVTDRHVIVVASVAAIYGCFNPTAYRKVVIDLKQGQKIDKSLIKDKLFLLGYKHDKKINPGNCQIEENKKINKETGERVKELTEISIPPSQDYVGEEGEELTEILAKIEGELVEQKKSFYQGGKFLEAERLEKRVQDDLSDLRERGFCPGIENYSRYFDGRNEGETPF